MTGNKTAEFIRSLKWNSQEDLGRKLEQASLLIDTLSEQLDAEQSLLHAYKQRVLELEEDNLKLTDQLSLAVSQENSAHPKYEVVAAERDLALLQLRQLELQRQRIDQQAILLTEKTSSLSLRLLSLYGRPNH